MQKIQILFILFFVFVLNGYCYAESLLSVKNIEQRPLSLSAKHISTWKKDGIRIFVADKDAKVLQGPFQIFANKAVCWFHEEEAMQYREATIEVYFEGNVTILRDENYEKYERVFLRFETTTGIMVDPEKQPIETFEEPQEIEVVMRGEEIRTRKEEEFLSTEPPQKVPVPGVPKEEMVYIIADNIDSWQEGDRRIIVALGNVAIKKEDMTIDADNVILWFDQNESENSQYAEMPLSEIYAEGNVTVRREEDIYIADKIFENVKEDKGILLNGEIKTTFLKEEKDKEDSVSELDSRRRRRKGKLPPEGISAYIGGEEIKHVSKGQYEIKNGTLTTCGFGHPHYHFKGKKIRLVQRGEHNIVSSTHNMLYLDKYPVAYLPYLSLDVRKRERILRDWEFGSSSRFGSFFKSDWDIYAITGGKQKDWSDLVLHLDYLQKRGLGTGLGFEYRGQDLYGFFDSYYIKDHGEFDINRIPVKEEDRGTILWRHRQELPYDWRLDMEFSHLSDPRFLREFFPIAFKEEKDRETLLYLRRIQDTTAVTFLANEQINGFDTTVDSLRERKYAERLPEAAYRILGEPVWDNRFIYTSESAVTYFDDNIDLIEETVEPQPVVRIDTVNRIDIPFKPGFFHIIPFIEGRATGYTESVDTSDLVAEANGPATGRFIGSFGLDWSSTHWRTYSVYNDFFRINRLRHIFIPELRYTYSPLVTKDPNDLYQHDEIDALDSSQVLVVGVENRLQTKRGQPGYEKTVDFVYFDIDYYIFPTNAGITNEGINGITIREDDFIHIDFRSQLTDVVSFVSERNEFNTEKFRFDVLTAGLEVYNPPSWQYFIGHRFIRDISSAIILAANYRISEKWGVEFVEKYDLKSFVVEDDEDGERDSESRNLKTDLVLSRYFHDWIGTLTLELNPVRNDSSFRFDIIPRGMERPRRFWF